MATGEAAGGEDLKGSRRRPRLLSVVVPILDEQESIEELYRRLVSAVEGLECELIFVDDGSEDSTPEMLARLAEADERVGVLTLSRNFGHQAALTAGLDHAAGDVVVMLDADLQDPPELIPAMLGSWADGADVVHAVRRRRSGEPRWRLALIGAFYRIFGRLAVIDSTGNAGDFRLIDARALDALLFMRERNRFLRGMSVWVGFDQATLAYDRDPRFAGATKYPFRSLVRLALDGIISFSLVPLRIATFLGLIVSAVAFLGIPIAIAFKIAGLFVPGITTVLLAVLLLGGIQLLTLGIIGEYLGRAYEESKRRPIYLVGDRKNVGSGADRAARRNSGDMPNDARRAAPAQDSADQLPGA